MDYRFKLISLVKKSLIKQFKKQQNEEFSTNKSFKVADTSMYAEEV